MRKFGSISVMNTANPCVDRMVVEREAEETEHHGLDGESDGGEDHRLRQEFAEQGYAHMAASLLKPFDRSAGFMLLADTEHCHE